MALRVWLPLIGNLNNQGLSNVTVTNNGATTGSGKLGSCYYLNGSSNYIQISNLPNPKNITVAFWMKRNATTNSRQFMFTAWNGVSCEMTASNLIRCYVSPSHGVCDYTTPVTVDSGWIHVAYTFEDKVVGKLYVNGTLITETSSSNSIQWSTTTGRIGNYTNMYFNGCMNDFRFYDSVLSPREIKSISLGLVAHYPLSRDGFGGDNYITNSNISITTGSNNTTMRTTSSLPEGTVVTASCRVDADNVVWDDTAPYDRVGMEIGGFAKTAGGNQYVGAWAGKALSAGANIVEAFTGSFHGIVSKTVTLLGTMPANHSVGIYIQGVKSGTVKVSNPKLEVGGKLTPWIPATTDAEYAAMGLNDGIEYDCSGFCNNAEKFGSLEYSSDTPRYNVSTFFKAGDGIFGHPNITLSQFTIAFWGKHTVTGKMLFGSNSSSTNYNTNWYWYGDNSFRFPLGEYYYSHNAGSATDLLNTWTHFSAVYDGTKLVVYRNGIYEGEKAFTGNVTLQDISIGRGYQESHQEDGYVSDFRFYATALSADDVLELYHTPISIANNSTLLASEFVEV